MHVACIRREEAMVHGKDGGPSRAGRQLGPPSMLSVLYRCGWLYVLPPSRFLQRNLSVPGPLAALHPHS